MGFLVTGRSVTLRRGITRSLTAGLCIIASLVGSLTNPPNAGASPGDMAVLAYPLLAPDPNVDRACSQTVLSFTRLDGAAFRQRQFIDVQYQFTYNDPAAVKGGRWSDPWKPDGMHIIADAAGAPGGPMTVAVPFSLCTFQFR